MVCLLPTVARAQTPATGLPPFASLQSNQFDTVNLQNLNANISIPIVSSPGRGRNFNFAITYDTLFWTKSQQFWVPLTDQTGTATWGWKDQSPTGYLLFASPTEFCDALPVHYTPHYQNYRYVDVGGTVHPFDVDFYRDATQCAFPTGPRTGYALDDSGFTLDATIPTNPKITAKDGTVVTGTNFTDANGNFITATVVNSSETDWTDTAGHLALKIIKVASPASIQYKYYDPNGGYQTATLKLQTLNLKTAFACSGMVEYTGSGSFPSELDLPNGMKYVFTYEPTPGQSGYYTGRLQRVTLPTGGYNEYDYTGANDGISCTDASTLGLNRVINDGATTNTWNYVRSPATTTTVTAPKLSNETTADQTVLTFNNSNETSRKIYQGSSSGGTLLRTINTTWVASLTPATQITILEDNSTQTETETSYDSYGNLLTLKEHDTGSGTPGPILKTTTLTYLGTSAYITANVLNRVTDKTIADSTGAIKFRQHTDYDQGGFPGANCITGVGQHDDTHFGCAYTARGNPTTVTTYTDPVNSLGPITKSFTYDSLGNLRTAQVNCCQQEQFKYYVKRREPENYAICLRPLQAADHRNPAGRDADYHCL